MSMLLEKDVDTHNKQKRTRASVVVEEVSGQSSVEGPVVAESSVVSNSSDKIVEVSEHNVAAGINVEVPEVEV